MTLKKALSIFIIGTILLVLIFCLISKPETYPKIGESYADKIAEPNENFPIYNNETSYQPGDVRTLPNVTLKEVHK